MGQIAYVVFTIVSGLVTLASFGLTIYLTLTGQQPGSEVIVYGLLVLLGLAWAGIIAQSFAQKRQTTAMDNNHQTHLREVEEQCRSRVQQIEDTLGRQARMALSLPSVHNALQLLRDVWFVAMFSRLEEEPKSKDIVEKLCESLGHLAQAFGAICGTHCWLVLKDVTDVKIKDFHSQNDSAAMVKTLAESEPVSQRLTVSATQFLEQSTDFVHLLRNPADTCFMSNDLQAYNVRNDYNNPEWPIKMDPEKGVHYNSTIVWPVRKRMDGLHDRVMNIDPKQDLIGILCLRCSQPRVLDRKLDPEIGAAYVDALYGVLKYLKTNGEA
ncbi:MAG: hypothetical protein KJ720_08430 [Proteobacteria bacterium]|nr:hypothetical protein [Pseudomonadota bacterium]MBU2469040.1 hypothetical protein [Pseudomonadota bacterium]MBU2517869.1 hypothetical protein [Pseudomonadota bacterium]